MFHRCESWPSLPLYGRSTIITKWLLLESWAQSRFAEWTHWSPDQEQLDLLFLDSKFHPTERKRSAGSSNHFQPWQFVQLLPKFDGQYADRVPFWTNLQVWTINLLLFCRHLKSCLVWVVVRLNCLHGGVYRLVQSTLDLHARRSRATN